MEIQLRGIGGGGGGHSLQHTPVGSLAGRNGRGKGGGVTAPFSAEQYSFLPINKNNSPRFRKVGHRQAGSQRVDGRKEKERKREDCEWRIEERQGCKKKRNEEE